MKIYTISKLWIVNKKQRKPSMQMRLCSLLLEKDGAQYLSPSILGLQMREESILLKALCNLTGHARQIVCMQSGNFTKKNYAAY